MRKQIALCIGNDDYQFPCLNKLKCASNDAIAVSEKLKMLNFDVITHTNLDRNSMHSVVDDFEVQLSDYDVALFYYAGHGFESNGDNLLMPIDTDCLDTLTFSANCSCDIFLLFLIAFKLSPNFIRFAPFLS